MALPIIEDDVQPELYRIHEACSVLGVTRTTIWRWIRDGRLEAIKVNDRVQWITRKSVFALMEY